MMPSTLIILRCARKCTTLLTIPKISMNAVPEMCLRSEKPAACRYLSGRDV